ncbi:MAG: Wss1p-related putative metallopeptidase [Cetobacterium sp.]
MDDKEYMVVAKYQDAEKAAELIANLNSFAGNLISELKKVYLEPRINISEKEYNKGREVVSILMRKFNPKSMRENEPDSPKNTSFTTNKGEIISMCLREKQSGENKFHDMHTLQFVFLHELAHIITKEMDHVSNFWVNFRFLLEFCKKYNLYETKNYNKENINYCGMEVTYSPLEDRNLYSYF